MIADANAARIEIRLETWRLLEKHGRHDRLFANFGQT
jgi:hypothetical protein